MLPPQQGRRPRFCRSAPPELLHPEEGKGKITLNNNWKDKAYSYFCHEKCEYFPCHNDEESCTFCYCPFYPCADGSTGGKWIEDKNVWNCKECNWVHQNAVVDEILDYVKENIKSMEDFDKKKKDLLKLRRATIYKTRDLNFNRNYEIEE